MHKVLKAVAVTSVVGIMITVLAGAIVTKTGSGDGCGPNWPLCHGRLIPPEFALETIIEYTHRLVTGIVGLFIFVFSVWAGMKYRHVKEVLWTAVGALFFLLLQSAMGALAVVYGQSAIVMALHFGFSILSYTTVFLLAVYIYQLDRADHLPRAQIMNRTRHYSVLLWVYSYIVVYLGALVRHTNAGTGCSGWPLCNGQIIPTPFTGGTAVHFIHRLSALLFLVAFIAFFIHIRKHYRNNRLMSALSWIVFLFAIAEVLSGGLLIMTGLDIYASLLHAFLITAQFGFLSYIVLYTYREPLETEIAPHSSMQQT